MELDILYKANHINEQIENIDRIKVNELFNSVILGHNKLNIYIDETKIELLESEHRLLVDVLNENREDTICDLKEKFKAL